MRVHLVVAFCFGLAPSGCGDDVTAGDSSDSGSDSAGTDETGAEPGEQPDPADALFAPGTVAEFDISLSETSIAVLQADGKIFVPGSLSATIGDQQLDLPNIGVRLKGNYGSYHTLDEKAAFLLDFNRYVPGQTFLGLEKLALNNMVQDPSMQREVLGYRLFRAGGAPAPRAAHAVVTVNGFPYGLYTTVESADNDVLLDEWYGDHHGNLYEGAYGSDLSFDLLSSFDLDNGDNVDFADLVELILVLDSVSDPEQFVDIVGAAVDLDLYLTTAATSLYLGDWDGYAWSRNNYYMYRRPVDQRWVWMPWGIDQTMADDLDPFAGKGRLTQMCNASLECRIMLAEKYEEVVARVEALALASEAAVLGEQLNAAADADPRKPYDMGTVQATIANNIAFLTNRGPELLEQLVCIDTNTPMCSQCTIMPLSDPDEGDAAFCLLERDWAGAEADCVLQGGHLISVHDQDTQDFLTSTAFEIADSNWWIGLGDSASEGTFAWSDGTPLDFTAWNGGEPNNSGEEDCVHLAAWAGGSWNDLSCATEAPYICWLP